MFPAKSQLRSRLIIKDILDSPASFKLPVFRTVRPIPGKSHVFTEITRGLHPQLKTTPLQLVKTDQLIIRSETNTFRVIISQQSCLDNIVYIFI